MTNLEIQATQNEISTLHAENRAIALKINAATAVGSILGLVYANRQAVGNWGKIGCFFAGGTLVAFPFTLAYTDKQTKNTAKIEQLQWQLNHISIANY